MIYDQHGYPIQSAAPDQVRGGWVQTNMPMLGAPMQGISQALGVPVNRAYERAAARAAFFLNPLLYGAINVIHGFTLGQGVSYGEISDKTAAAQVEEFWFANDLEAMQNRWFYEYLIDGENLTLFPTGENKASASEPAMIGFMDVARAFKLESEPGNPNHLTGVRVHNTTRDKGEFLWTAHMGGFWNDPRGWPVVMQVVPVALSYINFVNHRIRVHEIQSRINAVYKAFIFATDDKAARKEQKEKSEMFAKIPKDGAVLTIGKNPKTGESEEFDFTTTTTNAKDSAEDGRIVRLLLDAGLNLPEHFLGYGGGVTRTTADSMSGATKRALEKYQGLNRRYMQALFRLELMRRNGKDRKYMVKKRSMKAGRTVVEKRFVTAHMLEIPLYFPKIDQDTLTDIIAKVRLASENKYASVQTQANELGYDYIAEQELMAEEPEMEGGNENNTRSSQP
jgi:hypothetical protein